MIHLRLSNLGDHAEVSRLLAVLAAEGFHVQQADEIEGGDYTIVASPSQGHSSPGVEELEVAVRELRNLDVAKSQFLANVSHELRTPLTAIVTYGEVLRDGLLGQLNDRQREAIQSVIGSSRQLLSMIEEILTYAKTGARPMELQPTQFAIGSVIETVHDMSASLIRKKGIRFEVSVQRGLPAAMADRDKIIHVLTNLIGNAIEFTPGSEGVIRVAAARWEQDPNWLCVTVEDNGIGIDVAHHDMIFREFAQVDSSRSRQHHGTGLGLAIAKNFVLLHGGQIGVESEVGRGSTFYFTVPSVDTPIN